MSSEVWLNGQPPVGCECEYSWEQHAGWYKIKVLAIGETHLFIRHIDVSRTEGYEGTLRINEIKFRPLKTQEDTEREEAINNVCNDLGIMLGTNHDRIDAAIDSMLKLGYHNGPKMGEVVGVPQTRNLWRESDYNSYDVFIARNFTIIKKEEL